MLQNEVKLCDEMLEALDMFTSRTESNTEENRAECGVNITVIDAPPGAGKTSWAIQNINGDKDQPVIYATPYLAEIKRIREECSGRGFLEPQYYMEDVDEAGYVGCSKIESFNTLLRSGENIAVSHQTFLNATSETIELIRQCNYKLLIDEALEVVINFNQLSVVKVKPEAKINQGDIKMMIDKGFIDVDETKNGLIQWISTEEYGDWKYKEFENLVKLGRVYLVGKIEDDHQEVVTVFPPEIFHAFENVYLLTYMFDASIFRPYLDLFCVPYEVKTLVKAEDGDSYVISDYNEEYEISFREFVSEMTKLYPCKQDQYTNTGLSRTWYDDMVKKNKKNNKNKKGKKPPVPEFTQLRNDVYNFFRRKVKASAAKEEIMWTCFSEYKPAIQMSGFIRSRGLNKEELSLPEEELKMLQRRTSCFVPCNAKATNEYRSRWALAYCINMNLNPMTTKFFSGYNDVRIEQGLPEVSVNANMYSLSCLIQWMFRSRIRDGEPIHLYLPSPRMYSIFTSWLKGGVSGIRAA